ncbi:amino acid adenylation domain-containing protein [Microseira sp. BLCC-F43]|jgi:amino acid adenylation domain-containing protein|uniref:amino acid adenylation domain-containing protein n=1 Tax=Microseira sp. BLCC-F43 TaxID=3153602 RepID=UPI0035BB3146
MQTKTISGFRLSPQQKRLWLLQQDGFSTLANCAILLEGNLQAEILKAALQKVVERHEILRTNFRRLPGMKTPVMVVEDRSDTWWRDINLTDCKPEEQAVKVEEILQWERPQRFAFEKGTLLRSTLITLSPEKQILAINLPALCADSWTLNNLVREIGNSYAACLQGEELEDGVVQYVQFSEWQNQLLEDEDAETGKNYWQQQDFSNLDGLKLPFENTSFNKTKFQPGCFTCEISSDVTEKIEALVQKYDISADVFFLACWQILLWRLTGETDIIVGTGCDRREYEELHDALGLFATWLPIHCRLTPDLRFWEVLELVNKAKENAEEWQDYFVEEKLTFFPFGFEFEQWQSECFAGGVSFSVYQQYTCIEPFKVKLTCTRDRNSLKLSFHYDKNYYSAEAIARLAGEFETLLAGAIENPENAIAQLEILSESERQQLLVEFNNTKTNYSNAKCIHQLFEEQVERSPEKIALVFENQQLTYSELNARANKLAHYLQRLGVKPEVLVGLYLERSLESIIGLLAILKAGGAYLPLDPALPPEGLSIRLQDAQVSLVLTQKHLVDTLPKLDAQIICLDKDWDVIAQESDVNPSSEITVENLIYVLFTSGSTGKPKGVAVEHRQLLNYLNAIARTLNLPADANYAIASTLAADLGNTVIFPSLCTGGCLHILSQECASDSAAFAEYCRQHPIDCLKIVPSHISALLNSSPESSILPRQRLILGGETASWKLIEQIRQLSPNCTIFNHYGPTEATVGVTTFTVKNESHSWAKTVPLGRPIANTQLYVLDSHLQPVPIGCPGELYIGGASLARGYLNQPELTAEKFIPHPFNDETNAKLYKTGDLVRYLPDGNLEFIGRIDNQVKIRGFRIELGEIEAALRQHPAVREVVVLAREDETENKRLVAYIVPAEKAVEKTNYNNLRLFLREKLPEYMVPSAFVMLKSLPLTPNGKVDRVALPECDRAQQELERTFVAPRTPVEEILAGIWAKILGLEQVSIHDNFFDLGGHSLLATQVISRMRETFKVELPLRCLFESPTVAELAQQIVSSNQIEQALSSQIQRSSRDRELPLSFAQQRLWFLHQLEPDSPAYNLPKTVRLRGKLNIAALEGSLREVMRRHEILRTNFPVKNGKPVQIIAADTIINLPVIDLHELPETEREAEALRLAMIEAQRPFDLANDCLLRGNLVKLDEEDHLLLLTLHHIISDGWSTAVLIREVAALYQAFCNGTPSPLPELPIQYADFAVWQQQWSEEYLENQLTYWKQQLSGDLPILELPSDRPRPAVQTFNGSTRSLQLSPSLSESLKSLSQQQGVTLFMTLLAAFKTLLHRYTGQEDILVGSPIANRDRQEIEQLIGFFVNTLVLRTNLEGNPSFQELLKRVREVALGAYAHQNLPFEKLVDSLQPQRDLSHTPLFQVMFVLQNAPTTPLELPDLTLKPLEINSKTAKFDLTLYVEEADTGLIVNLEYNTDLFDASTINRMLGHYQKLLESIVVNSHQRLSELSLLTEAEQQQLLVEWLAGKQGEVSQSPIASIHQLFEAQVERTPDAVAVIFEDKQLSYQELNQRANQLAHYLISLGVKPEVLVGICVERSLEMLIALLAILKAGAAYVPLDPAYPQERIAYILEDAQISLLLTQQHLIVQLPQHQAKVICLDTEWNSIAQENKNNLVTEVTSNNLAYVIYTSGSTGKPKGVQIQHGAVVNFLTSMRQTPGITERDILLSVTTITFDIAGLELYLPLIVGASVVIASREVASDGIQLLAEIADSGATIMQATPATWRMLLEAGLPKMPLKILCGGEALPQNLSQQLLDKCDSLWNLYGPTETTIWSAVYQVNREDGVAYIGKAIANTQIYILDKYLNPVPIGIPGELYIAGDGLARGYFNQPELTAEKFIPNPFSSKPGVRLYKTGDLARYLPDGNIEFIGRIDYQVKIRGFRIELGEIEAVLSQHPEVQTAVVLAPEDETGNKRLVAYLVPEKQLTNLKPSDLLSYLEERLPNYMVPSSFAILESLPLTPNGKIDRKALPKLDQIQLELAATYAVPRNPVEQILAEIWAEVLALKQVGIHDNFFQLGGDSILTIQVISKADRSGLSLTPKQLFTHQTIAKLAALVDTSQPRQAKDTTNELPLTQLSADELAQVLQTVEFEGGEVL